MNLEEMILKCGPRFKVLKNKSHRDKSLWMAQAKGNLSTSPHIREYGETPKQAVRNLMLIISPKE